MKKIYFLILGLIFSLPVYADINLEPLLNKVSLQLQAEQWVTTKTALVNVAVNAAVTDQAIENVQVNVMNRLSQLSDKGEWHIVSFNRQLDKSGLETIQIMAQARLPQTELANLRNKAKAISKPGETYTIDSVQFIPSEDEIRQADLALRNNLYQQAKAEIDTLNKAYPDQKYYLHQIDFSTSTPPVPTPMAQNMMFRGAVSASAKEATPLTVGNKVTLQANVVLASMPEQVAQKIKP